MGYRGNNPAEPVRDHEVQNNRIGILRGPPFREPAQRIRGQDKLLGLHNRFLEAHNILPAQQLPSPNKIQLALTLGFQIRAKQGPFRPPFIEKHHNNIQGLQNSHL